MILVVWVSGPPAPLSSGAQSPPSHGWSPGKRGSLGAINLYPGLKWGAESSLCSSLGLPTTPPPAAVVPP